MIVLQCVTGHEISLFLKTGHVQFPPNRTWKLTRCDEKTTRRD